MPRFAITTGRKHGETVPRVLIGPEVSLDQQKATMRILACRRAHPELAEVQLWESDSGVTRTIRLRKPAEEKPGPEKAKDPAPKSNVKPVEGKPDPAKAKVSAPESPIPKPKGKK